MEPSYDNAVQVVFIKIHLPKEVGEDVVDTYVKTMGEVWVLLDEKNCDPLSIADGVCENIDKVMAKTPKKERVPKLKSLLNNAMATLETCSQIELVRSAEVVRHWVMMLSEADRRDYTKYC